MQPLGFLKNCFLIAIVPALVSARPPSGSVDAQISYVRPLTNGYQLVVAKDDGSGAAVIYSSPRMLSGDLGPDGLIYIWDGGRFGRMPATGGTFQPLFDSQGTIARKSDLSRDGTSVAWFHSGNGQLYRYDIATNHQELLANIEYVVDLTYNFSGSSIIYGERVSDTDYKLMAIPAGGGSPNSLGLVGPIAQFDSAHGDSTLAVTFMSSGVAYVGLWKPGMSNPVRLIDGGYNATYRCDDSAILFTRKLNQGPAIYRRSSSGAVTVAAKPSAIFPSYRPNC